MNAKQTKIEATRILRQMAQEPAKKTPQGETLPPKAREALLDSLDELMLAQEMLYIHLSTLEPGTPAARLVNLAMTYLGGPVDDLEMLLGVTR